MVNANLAAQYAAGTPVQVVYQLATPVDLQAAGGVAMPALSGINTILSDANSLAVVARKDPVRLLAGLDT